jgi:O-antigen/teichoic acid export membrane protein
MFMHKVGLLLCNTVDGTVISMFVGLAALGKYSNYTMILTSATSILTLVFSSLTSVIGHLCVEKDKATAARYCEAFHLLNFVIGAVFYLGYYAVSDDLVSILFSAELTVEREIVFVIAFNGFIQFLRNSVILFRDATGTFYHDRYKPLVEGVANIVLSVILVLVMGVSGVIVATIITTLLICHTVEPHVLYKNAFGMSPRSYYIQNYLMIGLFFGMMVLYDLCSVNMQGEWMHLVVNGCISVGISLPVCAVVLLMRRELSARMLEKIRRR